MSKEAGAVHGAAVKGESAFLAWLRKFAREPYESGLFPVLQKEFSDQVTGIRFVILGALIFLTTLASLYVAAMTIRSQVAGVDGVEFIFLRLFTTSDGTLPSFVFFLAFLAPLLGLALGFDAVNGEHARRTLSRLLSQPIHRDAVINGKFLAGFFTIAWMLAVLGLLVGGLGLILIGVPPTLDEVARLVAFYFLTVLYVAFWMSLSMLLSVVFRQASTSALTGIAIWLFFSLFGELVAGIIAEGVIPARSPQEEFAQQQLRLWLSRLSPAFLYTEATVTLLIPTVRTLGPLTLADLFGSIPGSALPFGESLLLIWPHAVGLLGVTLLIFVASYTLFMRREIRA